MIIEAIKTSFKVLTTNKLRTILTMLGIVIGIFSISIIFAISNGTKKSMKDSLEDIEKDNIYCYVGGVSSIERDLIENDIFNYVKDNPKIKAISLSQGFGYKEYESILSSINYDNPFFNTGINTAIDENYTIVNTDATKKLKVKYGKFFERKDLATKMPYVVMREDVAEKVFGTSKAVGKHTTINNVEFEVIGILEWGRDEDVPNTIISYYFLEEDFKMENTPAYSIKVNNPDDIPEIKGVLNNIFSEYVIGDKYAVDSADLEEALKEINSAMNLIELVFVGIASLSIIVGGIGIMNIMLVSVSERIKETGVRIALGARNIDIIIQFLIEGIMIMIFSGIIGLALAYLVTLIANNIIAANTDYPFKLIIDFMTCIYIVIFCGVLGIVFGIYPAIKAGKLDPVEALKYE